VGDIHHHHTPEKVGGRDVTPENNQPAHWSELGSNRNGQTIRRWSFSKHFLGGLVRWPRRWHTTSFGFVLLPHTHTRVESIRVALMDGGCPETERWGRGRCGRLGREWKERREREKRASTIWF
jgi:hypothetical protein